MADDLYNRDFYAWTQVQAEALRARRSGLNALDYDNLAEEIEDAGSEALHACESLVDELIRHLLKIEFIGTPRDCPHWKVEVSAFRRQLRRRLTATIRNKLVAQIEATYADTVKDLRLGGMMSDRQAIEAKIGPGYTWEQIIDPDWYPEPRTA